MSNTRPLQVQPANIALQTGQHTKVTVPIRNEDGSSVSGTTGWSVDQAALMPRLSASPKFSFGWGPQYGSADFSVSGQVTFEWAPADVQNVLTNTPSLNNQIAITIKEPGATVGSLVLAGNLTVQLNAIDNL